MTGDVDQQAPSTKPYLVRALHEWCTDNGFTPYLAVQVDDSVRVPVEHVRDGEIVLNVGYEATNALKLGNDYIEFKARFGGVVRDVMVPITHVLAIYAKENGQGMGFSPPGENALAGESRGAGTARTAEPSPLRIADRTESGPNDDEPPPHSPGASASRGRPQLKRVK